MLDKVELIELVIKELERERNTLASAALEARQEATHSESKAESKYDTRGLEASYLAGAQAKKAKELERSLFELNELKGRLQNDQPTIGIGSLFTVNIDGQSERQMFMLPFAGGLKIQQAGQMIQVLTPNSPMGQEFMGRGSGESFEFKNGAQRQEYEIISCC